MFLYQTKIRNDLLIADGGLTKNNRIPCNNSARFLLFGKNEPQNKQHPLQACEDL